MAGAHGWCWPNSGRILRLPMCMQHGLSTYFASPWVLSSFFFSPESCLFPIAKKKKKKKNVATGKLTSAVPNRMTSTGRREFPIPLERTPGRALIILMLCRSQAHSRWPVKQLFAFWGMRKSIQTHETFPEERILISTNVCCLLHNLNSNHFGE